MWPIFQFSSYLFFFFNISSPYFLNYSSNFCVFSFSVPERICFRLSFDPNIYLRGPLVCYMSSSEIQEYFKTCQKSNRNHLADVTSFSTAWHSALRHEAKFGDSCWHPLLYGLHIYMECNLHQDIPVTHCSLSVFCSIPADVVFLYPNCKGALEQEYPWQCWNCELKAD